jgi:hypothetical protein
MELHRALNRVSDRAAREKHAETARDADDTHGEDPGILPSC